MNTQELIDFITQEVVNNKKFFSQQSLINLMNENALSMSDRVCFITELRKQLLLIASREDSFWPKYSEQIYDTVELNLLSLAYYCPVNHYGAPIQDKNVFLTMTGYKWDLAFSGEWIKENRKNPATHESFNTRDEAAISSILQLPPKRNADWTVHGMAATGGALLGGLGGTLVFMIVAVVIFTAPVSWAFVGAFIGMGLGFCAGVALSGLIQDLRNTCCPKLSNNKTPPLEKLRNAEQENSSANNNISIKHIGLPPASSVVALESKSDQHNDIKVGVTQAKNTAMFSPGNGLLLPSQQAAGIPFNYKRQY